LPACQWRQVDVRRIRQRNAAVARPGIAGTSIMRTTTMWLLGALALSACQASSGSEPTSAPTTERTFSAHESTVRARMQGHERLADAMRDAVARGDLDEAKGDAKLLSALRIAGPGGPRWDRLLDTLRAAATQVAGDSKLADAARDIGTVARACADCHETFGRSRVLVEQMSARAAGVRAFMLRHQWGAERLWEGLVVPSGDAWSAGAVALSEDPLAPEPFGPDKTANVRELAQTVHDLGRRASLIEHPGERADLYGSILATCADCHQQLGGGPEPGGSR